MGPVDPAGDPIIGATLDGLRRAAEEVEEERSLAETLQRSLLPTRLGQVPGLRVAARYLPSSVEGRVGGDWYDVIALRDGRAGLVIGDVVGRGLGAAAHMAHLQSAVRAYALDGLRPSVVLERTHGFALELDQGRMATMLYAVLDLDAGAMKFAVAGHPPPLVVAANGEASFARGRAGSPLGAVRFPVYEETAIAVEPGSTVVLYTDGLVERPGTSLDAGLEELRTAVSNGNFGSVERICQDLPPTLLAGAPRDDVAVLAIHLERLSAQGLSLSLQARAESLAPARRLLARWLRAAGAGERESYETLVAAGEACANAIAHAYPAGEASFDLAARRDGATVEIEVRDHGSWRAPRGELRRRGLTLMEELMDSVEIDRGAQGTTVILRRRLGQEGAA